MGSLPKTVWVLEGCLSWVSGSLPEPSFARSRKAFLQATTLETAHPQSYAPKWTFTSVVLIAGLLPRRRLRGCSLLAQLIGWGHTVKFQEILKSTLFIFLPSKMNLTSQRWGFMFREKVGGILTLCSTQQCFKTLGCALGFFFFWCESCSVVSNSLWPRDCSPPGFPVYGILQARILEWVAIPFSRGSSWHRDQTHVPHIAYRFFTI